VFLPFAKSSGKWLAPLIVVAVGAVGLGTYLALRPSQPQASTTPSPSPTASPAVSSRSISALGRLEPQGEVIRLSAPSTFGVARVARLFVKEGDQVKQGQAIAVMDDGNRRYAEVLQAEAQVREAQARLAQVKAGAKRSDIDAQQAEISRLQVELQNAQREYLRYESLYRSGAISASDLDSRRLRVETTQKALDQAKQRLVSVAEVRPTDVQQAEAQVQVALANLQRAKAELETSVVRSPITGQVIKIHAFPGEQVTQDGIAELGRTQQMYAIAEIYETDIKRVKPGQRATISSPAIPSGNLSGTVESVGLQIRKNDVLNTDPAADTDARVVEVKIRLNDSKKVAGLTNLQVNVEIEP